MKNSFFLIRVACCIVILGVTLYAHIRSTNELTEIQRAIPEIEKEVKTIRRENERLQFEVDQFESPIHLMELLRKPEYSHLKYPLLRDIVFLPSVNEEKS